MVRVKSKYSRKERREMFEKYLSFHLRYAYESYARTEKQIRAKLISEQERIRLGQDAKDTEHIFATALAHYRSLYTGVGTPEQIETFNMFFKKE